MVINNKKYENLIITKGTHIEAYESLESVYEEQIKKNLLLLLDNKESYLDLVLFGTGTSFKLVPKELQSILISRNIKYESMISSAAYNTYNILLSAARNFISVIKLI